MDPRLDPRRHHVLEATFGNGRIGALFVNRASFTNHQWFEHSIIFKVGEKRIKCHPLTLTKDSEIFKSMFEKGNPGYIIEISDCDPESFEMMINFLESHALNDTLLKSKLADLVQVAINYKVPSLLKYIYNKLRKSIDADNCLQLWKIAEKLNDEKWKQECLEVIDECAEKVLKNDYFVNGLTHDDICKIISRDTFFVNEYEIVKGVMDWAFVQCKSLKIDESQAKLVLGSMFYLIRFSLMTPDELQVLNFDYDLLDCTAEQAFALRTSSQYELNFEMENILSKFNHEPRKQPPERVRIPTPPSTQLPQTQPQLHLQLENTNSSKRTLSPNTKGEFHNEEKKSKDSHQKSVNDDVIQENEISRKTSDLCIQQSDNSIQVPLQNINSLCSSNTPSLQNLFPSESHVELLNSTVPNHIQTDQNVAPNIIKNEESDEGMCSGDDLEIDLPPPSPYLDGKFVYIRNYEPFALEKPCEGPNASKLYLTFKVSQAIDVTAFGIYRLYSNDINCIISYNIWQDGQILFNNYNFRPVINGDCKIIVHLFEKPLKISPHVFYSFMVSSGSTPFYAPSMFPNFIPYDNYTLPEGGYIHFEFRKEGKIKGKIVRDSTLPHEIPRIYFTLPS